jgi:hypothetical protein
MSVKYTWSEARLWRAQNKVLPLHQLRNTKLNSAFHMNPAKQRWLKHYVFWRELWEDPSTVVRLAGITVTIVIAIGGAMRWYGLF